MMSKPESEGVVGTLERAIAIAAQVHAGHRDKVGESYILHPLRVMLRMPSAELRIIAVLHDVLEDSAMTDEDLRHAGFAPAVVEAVVALTRQPREPYKALVKRAARNPLARTVKLADIADNLDQVRRARLSAVTARRLESKYAAALAILCG